MPATEKLLTAEELARTSIPDKRVELVRVITAANGDWIKVGYANTAISFEPPPSPWLLWATSMSVIEGSGRFEDAQLFNVTWKGGAHLMTLETYSAFDGAVVY